jgi:hypothetical protein
MTREEVLNDQLDYIMDSFDFNKVQKMVSAADWVWASAEEGVPSEYELRKEARRMMKKAIKGCGCGTGGFRTWVSDGIENGRPWTRLNLSFGIDSDLDGQTHD